MPSTPGIRQQPGNRIPQQPEIRTRADESAKPAPDAAADRVAPAAPATAAAAPTPAASAGAPGCPPPEHAARSASRPGGHHGPTLDPHAALTEDYELGRVPETDRALVEAMRFFDAPDAEPRLPLEQMIYTPVDESYTFRAFPNLKVLPASTDEAWRAVQLNLTHDGSFGAALVVLAAREGALARTLRAGDKPGQFIITLRLPSAGGEMLRIETPVDARVPATQSGHVLGRVDMVHAPLLWPLVVAKGVGKLVGVLRASGHLPSYEQQPALSFTQFHTWLMGQTPQRVTDPRPALAALAQKAPIAVALQVPSAAPHRATSLAGGIVTASLGGMGHRLRSHGGHVDALLLNGHHYGVVAADPAGAVTLYNPLGFNPKPHADNGTGFFDPHSLGDIGKAPATIRLPAAWLTALGCTWFISE